VRSLKLLLVGLYLIRLLGSFTNQGEENLRANISITDFDRSKTTGECGIFQLFG
jgi:hypothetical protein